MALKQTLEVYELLDSAYVTGDVVGEFLRSQGLADVTVKRIQGEKGYTDFIRAFIPGKNGKAREGCAPTLGIIGRLGGIGARPERIGLVSDGDGAVAALAVALRLALMQTRGDVLSGDVVVTTHVCPNAPTQPHDPVPFMGSPVEMGTMNEYEVDLSADAILSIDTTKGNRVINHKGFAISPTVKEGYILRVSEDLLEIMQTTTGQLPHVFPLSTQDITPYGNGLYHLNSVLQPTVATTAPVVGVAITTEVAVPGCGTGASHEVDIASAVRFCIEVAKAYGEGKCSFYSEAEFNLLRKLYGSMNHLQTLGKP